jgi:hypothetical protein
VQITCDQTARPAQARSRFARLDWFQFLRMTAILSSFYGSYMDLEDLAKRIRDACIEAVLQAYEDAGVQGLCAEGRWEAAVSALRAVELAPLLREFKQASGDSSPGEPSHVANPDALKVSRRRSQPSR